MEFEEWYNNEYGVDIDEGDFDGWHNDEISKTSKSWNAALLNLPTCESCEYWTVIEDGKYYKDHWGKCDSGVLYADDTATPKDFGCIDHSEFEELKEKNDRIK